MPRKRKKPVSVFNPQGVFTTAPGPIDQALGRQALKKKAAKLSASMGKPKPKPRKRSGR